jgi:broad specificity phosphatase PhoE
MADCTRLFCLRHGESWNVLTGTAGILPNVPLTARGRAQAVMAAHVLASESIATISTDDNRAQPPRANSGRRRARRQPHRRTERTL